MEPAAGRRVDRARHVALEHDRLALRDQARGSGSGPPRGARRCRGASARRRARRDRRSRQLAEVHDHDAVRDVAHDVQVVRDEDVGQAELALQVLQEVENLSLHRDVERGHGLVADDQLRVDGERARDADPLPLAAGELVREAVVMLGVQADDLEHLLHAALAARRRCRPRAPRAAPPTMSPTRFRGFSDACGSWKTIFISRRTGRMSGATGA